MVAVGCLTTPAGQPTPLRLQQLGDQLVEVIKQLKLTPEQLATWAAMLDAELGGVPL